MKNLLFAAAGLTGLAMASVIGPIGTGRGQTPSNLPAEPFAVPVAQPKTDTGSYLPTTPGFNKLPAMEGKNGQARASKHSGLLEYLREQTDEVDVNHDIAIDPSVGPWVVCLYWYSGPQAAQMAREMVIELRNNPAYKLPAYVFTKGQEERKAELKRIREYADKVYEGMAKDGIPDDIPIRVPLTRWEIQCAVLVGGGFKDMDAAARFNEKIKKLPDPDPTKVKMHKEIAVNNPEKSSGVQPTGAAVQTHWVSPFKNGLVLHNPTVPVEKPGLDMALLRRLNEDEPFSLLKCPHKYTLVVKEIMTPRTVVSENTSSSFLDKLTSTQAQETEDVVAKSAHSYAEGLSKCHLNHPLYVLHMTYASYVTVGGFDDVNDPRIATLKQAIVTA
jgi:hypothetical protein